MRPTPLVIQSLSCDQRTQSDSRDYPIGFSDHSLGFELPMASAALGVSVIEKHFTLDKEMEGWDHKVSADKSELRVIASGTRRVAKALGSSR